MKIVINIDGLDCSGKQTLSEMLLGTFKKNDILVEGNRINAFPRYNDTEEGKALYHLLRARNKSEIENVIFDLFYNDHKKFYEKEIKDFCENKSQVLICDRSHYSLLSYNCINDLLDGKDLKSLNFHKACSLIDMRSRAFEESGVFELNIVLGIGSKADEIALKDRLDKKVNKDSNENMKFQKSINKAFPEVIKIIDQYNDLDRRLSFAFELSTKTEVIQNFVIEICRALEGGEHITVGVYKKIANIIAVYKHRGLYLYIK